MTPPGDGTTLLVSDVHAHYHVIDAQITHARETLGRKVSQVLVLGDFGLFAPNLHDFFRRDGRRFALPVAFIEGNHEDFHVFDDLVRDLIASNIASRPVYAIDPKEPWEEWFDFVELADGSVYQVHYRRNWE